MKNQFFKIFLLTWIHAVMISWAPHALADDDELLELHRTIRVDLGHGYRTTTQIWNRIQEYLMKGGDINRKGYDGTLLEVASKNGDIDIVKLLVANGADVKEGDPVCAALRNSTVFWGSSRRRESGNISDHRSVVMFLVSKGASAREALLCAYEDQSYSGNPTIIYEKNDPSIVTDLIAVGADVNAKGLYGATALINACETRNINFVKALLDNGADANAMNEDKETALMKALVFKYDKAYYDAPKELLPKVGGSEIVRMLIKHGADVRNTQALNYLVSYLPVSPSLTASEEESLQVLIDAGAANEDSSAFFEAMARKDGRKIVLAMIAVGANSNAKSKTAPKMTPLMKAVATNDAEYVRTFIAAKPNNTNLTSAMQIAVFNGQLQILQLLVDAGANVRETGTDGVTIAAGDTTLCLLALNDQHRASVIPIADYLLSKGVPVNASCAGGGTALLHAERNRLTELASFLRKKRGR